MKSPEQVINTLLTNDHFSRWLGIEVIQSGTGIAVLKLTVKKEMLNGFGIAHGGITYSLADTALAFASNSHGIKSVSVETSISHLVSLHEGDEIIAEATEESCTAKIALYSIKITNVKNQQLVAYFKGTVYRTSKEW